MIARHRALYFVGAVVLVVAIAAVAASLIADLFEDITRAFKESP